MTIGRFDPLVPEAIWVWFALFGQLMAFEFSFCDKPMRDFVIGNWWERPEFSGRKYNYS